MPNHKIRRARHLPDSGAESAWLAPLPTPPPATRLASAERADCVIIGAGFVGLAAARRLAYARPGWRTVVLEGQRAGDGASGRSSGFVVDLTNFCAGIPKRYQDAHLRLNRAGGCRLQELVATHDIDCDWDNSGWLHAASSPAGEESLAVTDRWLSERGERFERMDADDLRELTGSSFWTRALRITGSVLVDSGKLVRGIARSLPTDVELFEESPVVEIRSTGPSGGATWHLQTEGGSVASPRIILATNGGLGLFGRGSLLGRNDWLDNRVFPLHTFGSMSAPLSAEQRASLGGADEWGILGQEPLGSSVRRTREGRLLMRNTIGFNGRLERAEGTLEKAIEVHRRAFDARFPQLAGMPFEHSWHGTMGITKTRHPIFGQIDDGVWAGGAYAGMGIAMGTLAGELLVDRMLDLESDLLADMESMPGPGTIPPRPYRNLGIPVVVRKMNRQAGACP